MELSELTVRSFANLLGSDAPAPGGGSVAALAGSIGAALTAMVACLTQGRKKYADHATFAREGRAYLKKHGLLSRDGTSGGWAVVLDD